MANKSMFKSASVPKNTAPVTVMNSGGNPAFALSTKTSLAQLAVTGTFADGLHSTAEGQLVALCTLMDSVNDPRYLAKLAVYARHQGKMKDMPVAILAKLASTDLPMFKAIFPIVCDNGKQVKTFVQFIRSGKFGRKSFGTAIKKAVGKWFTERSDEKLLNDTVGNDPSLADVIKLLRPVPANPTRAAFYGWIIGKKVVYSDSEMTSRTANNSVKVPETVLYSTLPACVQAYEAFKTGKTTEVPKVDFRLITSGTLTSAQWKQVALNADFNMLRMNINTFERHGILNDVADSIAKKLSDAETIKRIKLLPYQLLVTYLNIGHTTPAVIKNALQDAMEHATSNVPSFGDKKVYVFPDVSGSMSSNDVTGNRGTATSVAKCIDVAALIASCVLRNNKLSTLIPFDTRLHDATDINPRDSVMSNSMKLRSFGGGGTHISLPMQYLIDHKKNADVVIYLSDNEANCDASELRGTKLSQSWKSFRKENPNAKLICINLSTSVTTQINDVDGVMNIGGFSDSIWDAIKGFIDSDGSENSTQKWVDLIEATPIPA